MTTAELRKIYDNERQKRLRPEGVDQYVDFRDPAIGDKLGRDPWVDYDHVLAHNTSLRDKSSIKFTIIGAGHAGLLYAVRLIDAGFKAADIVIVDTAGGFGGTWYWNRYPGLMCDVEGYVYMPLLEETGYVPENKYSYGAEIRGQCERIASHYQLQSQFCTQVTHQHWDDTKRRWIIEMTQDRGPGNTSVTFKIETQFLIAAGSGLNVPHVPKLPGFQDLSNTTKVFHSARWDWQYTGGSQSQPDMVNLRGKKVGIIGTGATAIQIVPQLAQWASHLYVFQRTPSYVGPRNQRRTTPEEWEKVAYKKGWQYERQDNFNHFVTNDPVQNNLCNDGWTAPDSHSVAGFIGSSSKLVTPETIEEHIDSMYKMDTERGERLRAHIANTVKDKATAEKLKPWYGGWCKRPAFHDDYLNSFNLPNVTLVDTDGKGVDDFNANGVVANGTLYDLDLLVLATGFTVSGPPSPSAQLNAPVIGRNGVDVSQKWGSPEYGTFYGACSAGFPNAFFSGIPGGGVSYNLTSAYDVAATFVANAVAVAHREAGEASNLLVIEPSKEAEDRYTDEVQKRALWFTALATCTPGWFNGEADGALRKQTPEEQAARSRRVLWGSGILDFKKMVSEYISKGTLEGFELRT